MSGRITRRGLLAAGAAVPAALLAGTAPGAAPAAAAGRGTASWPDAFPLPDGFQPEGIAIGAAPYAYFGSLLNGDVYRAELATGRGRVISEGPGTQSVGLKLDRRGRLFIAGGAAGDGRVVDARSGRVLASYAFGTGNVFVNDVVLAPDAAWFTDSYNAVLYRLPLGPRGELPRAPERLPLRGGWVQTEGFNANGLTLTPDGRGLLVVQSSPGVLFRVDPCTGHARQLDVPLALPNGDGMLLLGRTLYVVQQRQNAVDVLRLDRAATRAEVVTRITDPRFRVPTTVAAFGNRLYLPNSRFDVTPEPATTYDAVAVPMPAGG